MLLHKQSLIKLENFTIDSALGGRQAKGWLWRVWDLWQRKKGGRYRLHQDEQEVWNEWTEASQLVSNVMFSSSSLFSKCLHLDLSSFSDMVTQSWFYEPTPAVTLPKSLLYEGSINNNFIIWESCELDWTICKSVHIQPKILKMLPRTIFIIFIHYYYYQYYYCYLDGPHVPWHMWRY